MVRRLSQLEALTTVALECDELAERIGVEAQSRTTLATTVADLRSLLFEAPGLVAQARGELQRVAAAVLRGAGAEARRGRALEALAAAREAVALHSAVAELEPQILAAREAAARAAERWLDARERRLSGMAAELAGLLVDGDQCPVCGSQSHPSPAIPSERQVTSAEESVLLTTVTSLRSEVAAIEARRAELLSDRSEAVARSGGLDVPSAAAAVERAEEELHEARLASADEIRLTATISALETDFDAHRAALDEGIAELAGADQRMAGWRERLGRQQARLAEEIGPGAALADAVATTRDHLDRARELETALRSRDAIGQARLTSERRLVAALQPSEFDDVDDLLSACLSPTEMAAEEALSRSHQVELSTWSRVLSEPLLLAAAAAPQPDLVTLSARAEAAAAAVNEANAVSVATERRQSRLDALLVDLERLMCELEPLRAARDLADDVAGLCAGSSTDNATRTALSHYVLAARLSQVVAAANQRLEAIGGGRYQLEHTMVRGAGDNRGGLGLVVRDTHTDQGRDPATLSGGETFYVSLSLALGLADVVTAEAGGAELSTLFVDEGFGSLDDDTRDEVLDELDALRSGGRSVGLGGQPSERAASQVPGPAPCRGNRSWVALRSGPRDVSGGPNRSPHGRSRLLGCPACRTCTRWTPRSSRSPVSLSPLPR